MKFRTLQFLSLLLLALAVRGASAAEVLFSRDVLPILADRCFHCHGPDAAHREADLRLDERDDALRDRGGYAVLVPGKPQASELLNRITSTDPDLRMPPANAHRKPLSPREVQVLRDWIADGAPWGKHWSFEPPVRPDVPQQKVHPIDVFVHRRLQEQGLAPAPKAEPHTLLRRLSFDLTGLPPAPEEVAAFVADNSPEATARAVDRLLESPHYGERMAMWWLDAARYSDTDGYQQDATRNNWPWRDWVVGAFNRNLPFDQFTIQQFAGDLLPDATPEQKLATCFHRNHMTNGEGGRDPEESRVDYVIDRVNTTGTVWLGLTLGCCQCHGHKFDPISQQDYYSLFAFFNSIDENGKAGSGATPYLKYTSPFAQQAVTEAETLVQSRKKLLDAALQQAEQEFEAWLSKQIKLVQAGFAPWHTLEASTLESVEGSVLTQEPDGTIQASGPNPRQDDYRVIAGTSLGRVTGLRLEVLPHASHTDGKFSRGSSGEFILTDVKLQVRRRGASQVRDIELASAVADAEKEAKGRAYGNVKDTLDDDPRNGWTTATHDATVPHVAVFALAEPLVLQDDEELLFVMLQRSTDGDSNIGRFRVAVTDQPGPAVRSLDPMPLEQLSAAKISVPADLDNKLRARLLEQFLADHAAFQRAQDDYDRAARQLADFKKAAGPQNVMVLAERSEPRETYVLERGVWDKHGQEVPTAMPAAVLARPAAESQSRLDLARWLVDRQNPLTARVIVNQLWQMCFGAGLVRTPEDFGLQGEFPSHIDLLDWLAVEFMESGWDVQHILRLIVTSETYQQSSHATAEQIQQDPDNRLLARGPRFRLPSWMIRDAALKSSGLLNPALGGPPVMPYQPDGVWAEMFMGRFQYQSSQGPAQHRRTLYAFWRRSAAPTFLFDSAQRRVCEVRPRQTNTPLQALTLLNDVSLLEAARELAKAATSQTPQPRERVNFLASAILSRAPNKQEQQVLLREYEHALQHYTASPSDAAEVLDFGQVELRPTKNLADIADIAACMVVASMLYNLDEAITHE